MRRNCGKIAVATGAATIGMMTVIVNSPCEPVEYFLAVKVAVLLGLFTGKNLITWLSKPLEEKCCFDSRTRFIPGLAAMGAHVIPMDAYMQVRGD